MQLLIIFSLLSAITGAANNIVTKNMVKTMGFKDSLFYGTLFSTIVSLPFALLNFKYSLTYKSIIYSLILFLMQLVTLTVVNLLMMYIDVYKLAVFNRLYLPLMLIIDISSGKLKINYILFISLLFLLIGLYLLLKTKNDNEQSNIISVFKENKKIILLNLVIIVIYCIKPYVLKQAILDNCFNNESFLFTNYMLLTISYFIMFKPKIKINKEIIKQVGIKSISKPVGSYFYNMSILYGPVSIASIFTSTDIIITTIFANILLKEKINIYQKIGIILSFISIAIISFEI